MYTIVPLIYKHTQLFAAALLPKSKWDVVSRVSLSNRSISSSILSAHTEDWRSQWETLDCIDLHKVVPRGYYGTYWSMSDDDLKNVLVVIDAKNNLKSLKLTNCGRIFGFGLKPLKRSTVLERIDLSMAEPFTKPVTGMHTAMNLNTILPILLSIVDKNGNSLKHIQLPLRWRIEKQPALKEFAETYNLHLINDANLTCSMTRGCCENCAVTCVNEVEGARLKRGNKLFGIQSSTCYSCLSFACSDYEECKGKIGYCGNCQKNYCEDCVEVWRCHKCQKSSCEVCESKDSICYSCGRVTCRGCADNSAQRCDECGDKICSHCGSEPFECEYCPYPHYICRTCF